MNLNDSNLTMLAIDDAVSIQLILRHYFQDEFTVYTFGNGTDALTWIQSGNIPDIIVADINMPEMDGFTFIEHLKSSGLFCNIPLVVLSGIESIDTKIRCLELGADDFLVKPFNPRELSARLNNILRRIEKSNS